MWYFSRISRSFQIFENINGDWIIIDFLISYSQEFMRGDNDKHDKHNKHSVHEISIIYKVGTERNKKN